MTPTCPDNYTCTFTLVHPHVISHAYGPWYNSPGGIVAMAIVAVIVVGLVAWAVATVYQDRHEVRRQATLSVERRMERTHALALEEQRTMQGDEAKGNIEFLRELRASS